MPSLYRLGSLLAVFGLCVSPVFASAASDPIARCVRLYTIWWTYDQDPVFLHTGERAEAELAIYRCQYGRHDEGMHTLERLLRNGRFALPDK
jgi:hypothetical protein